MKNNIYTACLLFLLSIVVSCGTIHEYPDDGDCGGEVLYADLSLVFKFNKDDIDQIVHNSTLRILPSAAQADRQVRYTVEVYKVGDDKTPVAEQDVFVTNIIDEEITLDFNLPIGNYYTLAWVDYIIFNNKSDLFYNPQSLKDIVLLHPRGYDRSKEQFSGKKEINLKETNALSQKEIITMHRPGGKFRIIATDFDKYISAGKKKPSIVAYTYHNSVYNKFNVYDDTPSDLIANLPLTGEITDFDDKECIVALDWVIMKKEGTMVEVSFTIYDENGDVINEIPPIQFPVKRDVMTLVKGQFLTHLFGGDGGIGVDDEFEEEIEIIIPD